MAYGIEFYRANGSLMLGGLSKSPVLIDILTCPWGQSGTKSYARTNSAGALRFSVAQQGAHAISTTLVLGQGAIKYDYSLATMPQRDTIVYVFATNLTQIDAFGVQMANDAGEVLADQGFPLPQHVSTLQLTATADYSYDSPDGYKVHIHTTAAFDVRSASHKLVLLALPDSQTDDTWYMMENEAILANAGMVRVKIRVLTKAATYKLPSVHLFGLNNPLASSQQYGLRLYDSSGNLTFDSGAECLSGVGSTFVDVPAFGSTNTYTLPISTGVGLSIPNYYRSQQQGQKASRYMHVAKRVGTQLTFCQLRESYIDSPQQDGDYIIGLANQRYVPVADVSQQGYTSIAGTPAATTSTYPVFTTQPQDKLTTPGGTATFTVAASATPAPTFQWYKNGSAISGATGTSYTHTAASGDDQAKISCWATNALGTVKSVAAILTVDTATQPVITSTTPASGTTTVTSGTSVTIGFTATGTPTPTCRIYGQSGVVATGTGSVSFTYTANMNQSWPCEAETIGTYSHKTGVTLTVNVSAPATTPVAITSGPSSQTVTAGSTASFNVTASGTLPITFKWYKNNVLQATQVNGIDGTSSYSFTTSSGDNGAQVYCVATNGSSNEYSATSATATLTVNSAPPPAPVISQQPTSTSANQNGAASFSCTASPATGYAWYRNGSYVGSGQTHNADTSVVGTFSYYCIVSNGSSTTQSSTATLTVNAVSQALYPYYYGFSGTLDDYWGNPVEFDIFRDGSSSTGPWAGGSGDGTLYQVMATGNFTPDAGSFALNTWYDFSAYSGVGWIMPGPSINASSRTGTLNVTVRVKSSGSTVASGTITLRSYNNDGVPP